MTKFVKIYVCFVVMLFSTNLVMAKGYTFLGVNGNSSPIISYTCPATNADAGCLAACKTVQSTEFYSAGNAGKYFTYGNCESTLNGKKVCSCCFSSSC